MAANLNDLPELMDQLFGAGQGKGANGVNYNFAGGRSAFAVAHKRAQKSGQTVGQELALMVAEQQLDAAAKGAKVRAPAFAKTLAARFAAATLRQPAFFASGHRQDRQGARRRGRPVQGGRHGQEQARGQRRKRASPAPAFAQPSGLRRLRAPRREATPATSCGWTSSPS